MFDLSNVEAQKGAELLPEGKYVCNITNAEVKDTKSGTGKYIKIELTVANDKHKGRKIFNNFNVLNLNAQAAKIGMSQLKTMLLLAHYPNPENEKFSVTELNGLTVGVKTRNKSDDYGDKTEVHYFFDAKKEALGQADTAQIPF